MIGTPKTHARAYAETGGKIGMLVGTIPGSVISAAVLGFQPAATLLTSVGLGVLMTPAVILPLGAISLVAGLLFFIKNTFSDAFLGTVGILGGVTTLYSKSAGSDYALLSTIFGCSVVFGVLFGAVGGVIGSFRRRSPSEAAPA